MQKYALFLLFPWIATTLFARETTITVNIKRLVAEEDLFVSEGNTVYEIKDGIAVVKAENLPTLISLNSLRKRKITTHLLVWVETDSLTIEGSVHDNKYTITPASLLQQAAAELFNSNKKPQPGSDLAASRPFLVYLAKQIKFYKDEYIAEILGNIKQADESFWAVKELKRYLERVKNVGYDPVTATLSSLKAVNKENITEEFVQDKSKLLLVDFSATWCYYCLADIDKLREIYDQYQDQVEIVTLWDDKKHDDWLYKAKAQKDKIVWKSLRDPEGAIFSVFKINVYPTYILFDRSGKVIKKWQGTALKSVNKRLKHELKNN